MPNFNSGFLFDGFSIVLIDLLLAGDNAIVIAMAVRSLPPKQRRMGILAGAGGAVVLRIILTFFAAQLLHATYIKTAGGLLVLWIAVKLLSETEQGQEGRPKAVGLWQAVRLILVADLTMSTDNILAVAAASKGNLALLIAGLGLSITFVVLSSDMLSRLMDRYPALVYIGAAILGRVGGDMIVTDRWLEPLLHPSHAFQIGVSLVTAAGVLVAGLALKRRSAADQN